MFCYVAVGVWGCIFLRGPWSFVFLVCLVLFFFNVERLFMPLARRYFYYLNERGQLFHVFDIKGLIDKTHIPCGPTYLRNGTFLDFFYLRLKHNNLAVCAEYSCKRADGTEVVYMDDGSQLTPKDFLCQFPYVSVCGVENNFLKVQDAPVVFTDYHFTYKNADELCGSLRFGGSLVEKFQPSALSVTREGKLFHPVTTLRRLASSACSVEPKGLVGAQIGLKLGFDFVSEELDCDGHYVIDWNGAKYKIPYVD